MKQSSHGEAIEQKNHGKSGHAWLKFKYCQCCGFHAQLPGGSSMAWWEEHWHEDEFSPPSAPCDGHRRENRRRTVPKHALEARITSLGDAL